MLRPHLIRLSGLRPAARSLLRLLACPDFNFILLHRGRLLRLLLHLFQNIAVFRIPIFDLLNANKLSSKSVSKSAPAARPTPKHIAASTSLSFLLQHLLILIPIILLLLRLLLVLCIAFIRPHSEYPNRTILSTESNDSAITNKNTDRHSCSLRRSHHYPLLLILLLLFIWTMSFSIASSAIHPSIG